MQKTAPKNSLGESLNKIINKIIILGQEIKLPKTCEKRFYKNVKGFLCKKRLKKNN